MHNSSIGSVCQLFLIECFNHHTCWLSVWFTGRRMVPSPCNTYTIESSEIVQSRKNKTDIILLVIRSPDIGTFHIVYVLLRSTSVLLQHLVRFFLSVTAMHPYHHCTSPFTRRSFRHTLLLSTTYSSQLTVRSTGTLLFACCEKTIFFSSAPRRISERNHGKLRAELLLCFEGHARL